MTHRSQSGSLVYAAIAVSALLLTPGRALGNPPCGAVLTTDLVLDGDLDCSQFNGAAIRLENAAGLVIDGTAQQYRIIAPGNDAINGNGNFLTIKNLDLAGHLTLTGNGNTVVGVKAQNQGIYLSGSGNTVDHCDFAGSATGMYLTNGTGGTVTNTVMTNASTRGLYLYRMTSTMDAPVTVDSSNVFTGSEVAIVLDECHGLTLSNLTLDNPTGIASCGKRQYKTERPRMGTMSPSRSEKAAT